MRALDTARLHLRPLDPHDEALYCSIYTDAELMQHVGAPLSIEAARESFRAARRGKRWKFWVMSESAARTNIGLVALVGDDQGAEIGAMVLAAHQHNGYAAEAMAALMKHAFDDLQLPLLWGHHPSSNHRSTGLMDGLGFQAVPATREHLDCRWELTGAQWAQRRRTDP